MADPINSSDVFKFVTLRAPDLIDKKSEQTHFIRDDRSFDRTSVGGLVAKYGKDSPGRMAPMLKELISRQGYTPEYPEDDPFFAKLDKLVASLSNNFHPGTFKAKLEQGLGKSVKETLQDKHVIDLRNETWDRYYTFLLLTRTEPVNLEGLTKNLRLLHLLDLLAAEVPIPDAGELRDILRATVLVPAEFSTAAATTRNVQAAVANDVNAEKYRSLWNDFLHTYQALNEIRSVPFTNPVLTEANAQQVKSGRAQGEASFLKNDVLAGRAAFMSLSSRTKTVLQNANLAETTPDLAVANNRLTDKLTEIHTALINTQDPELLKYMPQEVKSLPGVGSIIANLSSLPLDAPLFFVGASARSLIKPLGVGDLKVVKQKLKKYVTGEVAHIENVLKGESKERKNRVLDRTENILTVSEATDEETTKDTQTTERFELKKESEKTVQEQMSVQAGVTVSGSYGMVTFGAHGDFAYSTSSTDSNKTASNFAKEVIDKSVTKIQKQTKTERTTKTLHEVEEINTHGLSNTNGTDNISGIYRWVDKYYEAQIYNYGKRMMFEFIIPEPAAFFGYAFKNKPKKNIVPPIPLPTNLTHKDITEWNYQTYIRNYNVQGLTPPPPANKTISISIDQSGIDNGLTFSKSSKELVVPEGYVSAQLGFSISVIYENNPQFKLSSGNDHGWATLTDPDARRRWDFVTSGFPFNYDSIIPVAMEGYDINAFMLNVSVVCNRLASKYETWQIQAFEKIMASYQALQADYEQKLNAQETQQGVVIQGQNPLINREIEKTELQKGCLKMLEDGSLYASFNAMKAGSPPEFDVIDAFYEGKYIQFFEQAFEWENITYLYYPYFWGRLSEWVDKSTTYDTDPLFTKFLQAGAARVVIPVHPSYNDAILYYLETGLIWNGGDSPRLDDPLFISIAEELRNQTDDLVNAEKVGDPWEVVLPTTLVYLQKDSDLPTYN